MFIIYYFRVSDVQLLYNTGHSPGQFRQDNNPYEIVDNSKYLSDTSRIYYYFIHIKRYEIMNVVLSGNMNYFGCTQR